VSGALRVEAEAHLTAAAGHLDGVVALELLGEVAKDARDARSRPLRLGLQFARVTRLPPGFENSPRRLPARENPHSASGGRTDSTGTGDVRSNASVTLPRR
jgi:hypothetical protein